MKHSHSLFSLVLSIIIFHSCTISEKRITHEEDYSQFLQQQKPEKLIAIEKDLSFWSGKLDKDNNDLVALSKIASLHAARYQYNGNVNELHTADSLYKRVNQVQKHFGSGTYRLMAANAVTMHRFKEAKSYLDSAFSMGDDKNVTLFQQVDVDIELGNMLEAENILQKVVDKTSFEYLIRKAKVQDHSGNLPSAIISMENAYQLAKQYHNKFINCWSLTNLGDMYSHDNRFEDAYRSYLEALKQDPAQYHALKGIAWLAFSHDKDATAAKNILNYLKKVHPVPDYDLLLSKIAAFEKDEKVKQEYEMAFLDEVTKPAYGGMYNKYIFNLYADDLNNTEAAYQLALKEIDNRPTGESYNLLCWSLYKKGEIEKAKEIAEKHVEKICYEPDALYHLGVIYSANGEKEKAKEYFAAAEKSLVELGPEYTALINE